MKTQHSTIVIGAMAVAAALLFGLNVLLNTNEQEQARNERVAKVRQDAEAKAYMRRLEARFSAVQKHSEKQPWDIISPGERCKLHSSDEQVTVFLSRKTMQEFGAYAAAKNVPGAQSLLSTGNVRFIPDGTLADVISSGFGWREVRLVGGSMDAVVVYVTKESCKKH